MLRKYSEYINENNQMNTSTVPEVPKVQEPKVQKSIVKTDIKKSTKKKVVDKKSVDETIIFNGKIVLFTEGNVKPSSTISLLESKSISKDKLHYIITEQTDSIVLLKYNIETKLNIKLFIENFIKYHKDSLNITEDIIFTGTDTFAIIQNVSESIKKVFIQNLQKLLK